MSAAETLRDRALRAAAEVVDPEIPVLTIADLGVLRDVREVDGAVEVLITPTYSGCPAMNMIALHVESALLDAGLPTPRVRLVLSPAWTTDWMSEAGKAKLKGYGIAPPQQQVIDISGLRSGTAGGVKRQPMPTLEVICPNCGSTHTQLTSQFGSTPCKALYTCTSCREPFDHFKCH